MAGIEPRGRESDEGTGLRRDEHGSGAPRTAGEKGRGQDEAQGRWQVQAGEWQAACPQPPAMRRAHLDQVEVLFGRVVEGVEVEDARLLLFGWLGHRRLRALLLVVGEGDGVAGRGARLGRLAGCPSRRFCSRRLCDLLLLLLVVVLVLWNEDPDRLTLGRLRLAVSRAACAIVLVIAVTDFYCCRWRRPLPIAVPFVHGLDLRKWITQLAPSGPGVVLFVLYVVLHLLLVRRGDGHLRRLRPLLLRMVLAARLVVVVVLLRVRVGLGR